MEINKQRDSDRETDRHTDTQADRQVDSQWVHLNGVEPSVEMRPSMLYSCHAVSGDVLLSHEDSYWMNPRVKCRRWQRNRRQASVTSTVISSATREAIGAHRRLVIGCTRRPDYWRTISQPLKVYRIRTQGCRLHHHNKWMDQSIGRFFVIKTELKIELNC